jgi:hypothetical protein
MDGREESPGSNGWNPSLYTWMLTGLLAQWIELAEIIPTQGFINTRDPSTPVSIPAV